MLQVNGVAAWEQKVNIDGSHDDKRPISPSTHRIPARQHLVVFHPGHLKGPSKVKRNLQEAAVAAAIARSGFNVISESTTHAITRFHAERH